MEQNKFEIADAVKSVYNLAERVIPLAEMFKDQLQHRRMMEADYDIAAENGKATAWFKEDAIILNFWPEDETEKINDRTAAISLVIDAARDTQRIPTGNINLYFRINGGLVPIVEDGAKTTLDKFMYRTNNALTHLAPVYETGTKKLFKEFLPTHADPSPIADAFGKIVAQHIVNQEVSRKADASLLKNGAKVKSAEITLAGLLVTVDLKENERFQAWLHATNRSLPRDVDEMLVYLDQNGNIKEAHTQYDFFYENGGREIDIVLLDADRAWIENVVQERQRENKRISDMYMSARNICDSLESEVNAQIDLLNKREVMLNRPTPTPDYDDKMNNLNKTRNLYVGLKNDNEFYQKKLASCETFHEDTWQGFGFEEKQTLFGEYSAFANMAEEAMVNKMTRLEEVLGTNTEAIEAIGRSSIKLDKAAPDLLHADKEAVSTIYTDVDLTHDLAYIYGLTSILKHADEYRLDAVDIKNVADTLQDMRNVLKICNRVNSESFKEKPVLEDDLRKNLEQIVCQQSTYRRNINIQQIESLEQKETDERHARKETTPSL